MNFIKINYFEHVFLALAQFDKDGEHYAMVVGRTAEPKLNAERTTETTYSTYHGPLATFDLEQTAAIEIPFISYKNNLFHFITLDKKEDYDRLVSILEVIL